MIYNEQTLFDALPIAFVDNDNYEYITVNTAENEYVQPCDPSYNFYGWTLSGSTVQNTINVAKKLHREMTDIMLNGEDWDEQEYKLRKLFLDHGNSLHERLHACSNLLDSLCCYLFDTHNGDNLDDFLDFRNIPNEYRITTDMLKLFDRNSLSSNYRSVSWWIQVKKYISFVINVHEQYGILPIFQHTVVGNENDYVSIDGDYYHKDSDEIVFSEYTGEHEWRDHCVWVESQGDYIPSDYCRYCDECDEYYLDNDTCNSCRENTRDNREYINEYHCTPRPEYKGILSGYDTFNPPKDLKNLARFTIGFEVEKRNINGYNDEGDPVNIQPFFSGWECDSSCGVEGISHIYSLDDFINFKKDTNESPYLDSDTTGQCGGHINISDTRNKLQYWHLTPWMGLMYSLYRHRLTKTYCSQNKKLCPYQKGNSHYNVIAEKNVRGSTIYELRMPSAVENTKQIQKRYLIMQHIMQSVLSFMEEDFSYTTYCYDHDKEFCPDPNVSNMVSEYFHNECYYDTYNPVVLEPPTYKRCRYIIEQLWHILTNIYNIKNTKITEIVFFTYLFQHWLDGNMDISKPQSIHKFLTH